MTTKLVVPPMPQVEKTEAEGNLVLHMYCTAVENWGQECATIAQREAALADELAHELENTPCACYIPGHSCLTASPTPELICRRCHALKLHKEARNG